MRTEDPWYDAQASGRSDRAGPPAGRAAGPQDQPAAPADARAAVYLTAQRSAAFQQVRRRYRRFVVPATAAFLTWYLAYVVAATAAPDLMARPLAGAFNVGMAAGLAQFATTFLLTWLYVRHARLRRDRLALELRWETQDMARLSEVPARGAHEWPGAAPGGGHVPPVRAGAPTAAGVPAPRSAREDSP